MASGKRASMREGPLADLFRKTEQAAEQAEDAAPGGRRGPRPRALDAGRPGAPRAGAAATAPARDRLPASVAGRDARRAAGARAARAHAAGAPAPRLQRGHPRQHPRSRRRAPRHDAPARDPYSRVADEPTPWGTAKPAGQPVLRVVGVGGAGVNAVNRMVEAQVEGVEFLAINTDLQSLQQSTADVTLHIGPQVTRGLGAGSNPDLGRQSAMEEYDRIKALLKGSDMVFIAAGAGGGTGTGAAPIVARIARELGALTVGIVTKPFGFEGNRARRGRRAWACRRWPTRSTPSSSCPTTSCSACSTSRRRWSTPSAWPTTSCARACRASATSSRCPGSSTSTSPTCARSCPRPATRCSGIGMGHGEERAVEAARAATESPLLETSMEGARKILLSITGGPDLSLWEINEAAKAVSEAAHPDANIIFGAMVDEKLGSEVWVTVVATGYTEARVRPARRDFEEPRGELRVERRSRPTTTRQTGLGVHELDVPEFIPRG